jgi:DNA-binding transcriptional LysR family regulator
MTEPLETAELLAFTRIVESKALSRAAVELGVPRATIGRRLARLEERLGVRLLRRSTRSLALTQEGELFYRQARLVLDALESAEESVRQDAATLRGNLRVTVPSGLDPAFSAMLLEFMRDHPEVHLQVDFSTRLVDLVREGYDVALRASAQLEPGLIARTVARHKLVAVASPAYLARNGSPKSARDLRRHRCLTGFARGELPETSWRSHRGSVAIEPVFSSNNLEVLRDAALDGAGIVRLPEVLVSPFVERGELVRVLPQVLDTENRLSVVYVERKFLPAHVRAFVDALVAWASAPEAWAVRARVRQPEVPLPDSTRPLPFGPKRTRRN